ncbi:MAG: FAD-dependent oxidoreductase, partial [Bacteroidota bacterium]
MKVNIIGGGMAGLFTAWYLLRAGQDVVLIDKGECGGGATHDAAGMLAPVNEIEFTELELLHAGLKSRDMYPDVAAELGDIGLDRNGTLEIGLTGDDGRYLKRLFDFQKEQGLPVEWLTGPNVRSAESFLSHKIPSAIWSPEDIRVDNRLLAQQLRRDCLARGMELHEHETALGWQRDSSGEVGVETPSKMLWADALVVACGTGTFEKSPLPYRIYPVRGEMVALTPPQLPFLEKTIRIRNTVLGNAYIVPKRDRILLGSTSEEKGPHPVNSAGGLLDILRKCYAAVPGVYELDVQATWAG